MPHGKSGKKGNSRKKPSFVIQIAFKGKPSKTKKKRRGKNG